MRTAYVMSSVITHDREHSVDNHNHYLINSRRAQNHKVRLIMQDILSHMIRSSMNQEVRFIRAR